MKKRIITDKYDQNDTVSLTVKNTPQYDGEAIVGYKPIVTIKVELPYQKTVYEFANDDAIADFIGTIDAEDPQQELGI